MQLSPLIIINPSTEELIMYKQVLQQIINERGSMNKDELLIFTYQLAAWIKLSKQDRLNDELNFTKKNNFEFKNN